MTKIFCFVSLGGLGHLTPGSLGEDVKYLTEEAKHPEALRTFNVFHGSQYYVRKRAS
jgi:hypothetical protein